MILFQNPGLFSPPTSTYIQRDLIFWVYLNKIALSRRTGWARWERRLLGGEGSVPSRSQCVELREKNTKQIPLLMTPYCWTHAMEVGAWPLESLLLRMGWEWQQKSQRIQWHLFWGLLPIDSQCYFPKEQMRTQGLDVPINREEVWVASSGRVNRGLRC